MLSSSFVGQLSQCLVQPIWDNQMKNKQPESLHKMQREDFLGCLIASIICIGLGRIAHLLGKGCTMVAMENIVWSLKVPPITTYGFGILSFGWREHTMISTYCSDLLCSQDWWRDILLRLASRSTATLTLKGTTSRMVSIHVGLHLWR
jgi:hypothetical protein